MTRPVIDPATFRTLEDTAGAEFVKELVATFLQEAPAMLKDLQGALAIRDADRFRRAAHSLKSNANTFGALGLGAMAKDLELAGVERAAAMVPPPVPALEEEYARVAGALEALSGA